MLPKRIILMRHSESEGNVDPVKYRIKPDHDIELTEKGIQQAINIGKDLHNIIPIDESVKVYCSPFTRTRQTLNGILQNSQQCITSVEFDPRIREREWSDWFGDCMSVPRDRSHNFFYRMKGGESCADVYTRITSFIESMEKDFDNNTSENVLILSHGTAIRVFLMRFFRQDEMYFYNTRNPRNGEAFVIEWNDIEYKLITDVTRTKKEMEV